MIILTTEALYSYIVNPEGQVATLVKYQNQAELFFSSWFSCQEEAVEYLVKHKGATVFN